MKLDSKIYIAGHRGMVGSAIVRSLSRIGYSNLLLRTRKELDLVDQSAVNDFFVKERPEYVFLAAAKVGGINANSKFMADFLYENMMVECNVIWAAQKNEVKKLCFLGSSCIYPRECQQPIKESYLLTGPLEPTNEGYAIAKIAGYKLCQYLRQQNGFHSVSLMPCNLYGENDDFDLERCHVFSALTKRIIDAADAKQSELVLWGTGAPRREFLNVDDVARAACMMMQSYEDPEFINVGSGIDISIAELAGKIASRVGYEGKIVWDHSKPDGMMRKLMDVTKIRALGFTPHVSLDRGIGLMIEEYRLQQKKETCE